MVNIPFRASRIPTADELTALLTAYESAPRPILVHCQAGADRTGEAIAIYIFNRTNGDRERAKKALSIKYHHVRLINPAMDYFIEDLYQGINWAKSYQPCTKDYKYFNKSALCQPRSE